eukprot:NODE_442_length_8548_cov_0.231862.p5 type:complete len:238 gc:universal NODE_442_length_8548_cov_0.231862:5189-5902(+)
MEAKQGKIEIDGIDISKIGLEDLRSALTIIPQDPVLFEGTIRTNLDLFNERDDLQVWNALRRVHFVSDTNDGIGCEDVGLDSCVTENGNNYSVGQRQLLSLARALINSSKVIIMDEATANVDPETDTRIQQTIRTEFDDSTILCIAHRLRTVIDFNRIMVLDQGKLVEFDTPYNLMMNKDGIFRKMCMESGEYEYLKEQADKGKDLNIVGSFRSVVSDDYDRALQVRFGSSFDHYSK